MSTVYRRTRAGSVDREAMAREALERATSGQSWSNFAPIIEGFKAKGIAETDILPRVNVLTYHAWRAAGRQVRRGEHGVKVVTFVPTGREREERQADGSIVRKAGKRPTNAVVFHISQTDAIGAAEPIVSNPAAELPPSKPAEPVSKPPAVPLRKPVTPQIPAAWRIDAKPAVNLFELAERVAQAEPIVSKAAPVCKPGKLFDEIPF